MPTLPTPMTTLTMTTTMTHDGQSMIAQAHYQMSQKPHDQVFTTYNILV